MIRLLAIFALSLLAAGCMDANAHGGLAGGGRATVETNPFLTPRIDSPDAGAVIINVPDKSSVSDPGLVLDNETAGGGVVLRSASGQALLIASGVSGTPSVSLATGSVAISPSTTNPNAIFASNTDVYVGGNASTPAFLHFTHTYAAGPLSADCNADDERGRVSLDIGANRLYICNGASRGWDYVALTD